MAELSWHVVIPAQRKLGRGAQRFQRGDALYRVTFAVELDGILHRTAPCPLCECKTQEPALMRCLQ